MASTTTEENKRIVRRAVEGANEQDLAVFIEVFAEDVIDHTPSGETKGREGPKEGLNRYMPLFRTSK